jgi:hypothetical protein
MPGYGSSLVSVGVDIGQIAQKETGVLVATGVHSKVDVFTKDRMYEIKDNKRGKGESKL